MNSRLKQLILRQCFLIIAFSFSLNNLALAETVIKIDDAKYEDHKLIVKGEFEMLHKMVTDDKVKPSN